MSLWLFHPIARICAWSPQLGRSACQPHPGSLPKMKKPVLTILCIQHCCSHLNFLHLFSSVDYFPLSTLLNRLNAIISARTPMSWWLTPVHLFTPIGPELVVPWRLPPIMLDGKSKTEELILIPWNQMQHFLLLFPLLFIWNRGASCPQVSLPFRGMHPPCAPCFFSHLRF